ncbi:MAG: hypothetical protein RLY14_2867, partial [Planctomycetota bacterium]
MLSRSCPHCRNLIRLPDDIGPDSVLRCPICHNITIGSALALKADTTWIVVDPVAEQINLEAITNPETAQPLQTSAITSNAELDNQESYEVSEQQDDTPSLGFHIPKADRTRKQPIKHEDWVNFKPISHEDYQRRKRKSSSPFWQMIQVVLGGALAIPISLLLIWHVLGKDIGNIGPQVAKVAPWIVPKKFHPYPSLETDLPNNSGSRPAKGNSAGLKRDFDAELAQSLERSNQSSSSSKTPPPIGKSPESESIPEPNSSPESSKNKSDTENTEAMKAPATTSETLQPDDRGGETKPTNEKQKSSEDTPNNTPPTEAVVPELSNSEKLVSFIANTRSAMEQWPKVQSDSVAKRREVANDFYNNLSLAAEYYSIVSESSPSASVWKKEIRQLAQVIAQDPELMQLIRTGGFAKITRQADKLIDGSGFTVVGTIELKKDSAQQGQPETQPEPSQDKADTQASDTSEVSEIDSADANNETLYVVRIRKSLIASGSDANTSDAASEEVRERIVRLHPTTTIG